MAKRYTIRYSGHSVEMSKPSSTVLVYRIPYRDLKLKNYGFEMPNQFIVYILFGKNNGGKDVVYVGKSKNGLANRPTAHTDKYSEWTSCYIMTQFKERTFFNDGTIQYLEDKLNKRFNKLNTYVNTTEMTSTGTANKSDEEDCDDYLEEAYDMLFVLGLDLFTASVEADSAPVEVLGQTDSTDDFSSVPDGEYFLSRKVKRNGNRPIKAKMLVRDGSFFVLPGSEICPVEGAGLMDSIREIRNSDFVNHGILQREVKFGSPSSAGSLVLGASCNGWLNWKTAEGIFLDQFRSK